jgi:uncharacterized protein (TIGR02466 family)
MRDLFKISIYENDLNINNNKLLKHILDLKKKSKGVIKTNITGWQSNHLTLNDSIYNELNNEISNSFLKYINQIPLKNDFKITSMWANVNGYKDYNVVHDHGSSVISGVFYIKTPKQCGNIFFKHPFSQVMKNVWYGSVKENSYYNATSFKIEPTENKLILFPGWLEHGVESNLNKKEPRISISFNISKY